MSNLPECETKPSNKVTVKPPSPMGVPMTDQQRCSPTPQGNDSNVLPKHTDISSSDQRPGCSAHPHLLSQLLLLQCPQPFLLPVLSSSAFFFSPCTSALSSLLFRLRQVLPHVPNHGPASPLSPCGSPAWWHGAAARGASLQPERAAGGPGMASSLPPSSSLVVKRAEKE